MAENITLNNIATFVNDTTAVNTYNSNNTAIVNAFSDVMSRSGVSPNQMTSTLDMNNQQIINLPFPTTASSPARLIDISGGQISVVTATTGASGHTVPFLDGTNTWSAPQILSLGSLGTGTGLTINETVSGTNASGVNINNISITDSLAAGPAFSVGLQVVQGFGTSSATGGRSAILGQTNLLSATNASNTNRDYVGVAGTSTAVSADTGTNPNAAGTSAGTLSGGSFLTAIGSSATSLFSVCGLTANTQMAAGSSTFAKALALFSGNPSDAVNGSVVNTMLWLFNQAGTTAKWSNAILIDNGAGTGTFPLATTATIFKTGSGTVTNGIDLTSTTLSNTAFASPGFQIGPTGSITTGAAGVSSGTIQWVGQTSGQAFISTSATANLLTATQPMQIGVIGTTAGTLTLAGQTSGSAQLSCSATGSNLQLGAGNLTISSGGNLNTNGTLTTGAAGSGTGSLTIQGTTSGSVTLTTPAASGGLLQFGSTGSFSANAAVATVLGSVGPTGSHTAVQKWLTIVDNTGTTLYIPAF